MIETWILGEPQYDLRIGLELNNSDFSGRRDGLQAVRNCGLAIDVARRYLEGLKHVTTEGYLLNGASGISEARKAEVVIDENVPGLIFLGQVMAREAKYGREPPRVFLGFDGKSPAGEIRAKNLPAYGMRLYLPHEVPLRWSDYEKLEPIVERVRKEVLFGFAERLDRTR